MKELLSNYEIVPTKDILNYAIRLSDPEFKGLDYNIAYTLAFHKAQLLQFIIFKIIYSSRNL